MGVSLYYKGRLKSMDLMDELVSELTEISLTNNWKHDIIGYPAKEKYNLPAVKGIIFTPENCESLSFIFEPEGRLINIVYFHLAENNNIPPDEYFYFNFCKTQFAGVDLHIQLCNLLKYLANKYFSSWECIDDTGYYDTGNRQKVETQMSAINLALDALSDALNVHGENTNLENEENVKSFISDVLQNKYIEIKEIRFDDEE